MFAVPHRRHGAAALLLAAVVAGCGNGSRHPAAAVNTPTPVPVPTVTSTGADANLAMNRVVEDLRAHGLEAHITDIRIFTPETDPAHELGRPGAYVARATFTDSTLPGAARGEGGFARGATVELFTSSTAARSGAGHAPDQMPGEKDLVSGAVLLRLSPLVPGTLEDSYRTALRETTGVQPQVVA